MAAAPSLESEARSILSLLNLSGRTNALFKLIEGASRGALFVSGLVLPWCKGVGHLDFSLHPHLQWIEHLSISSSDSDLVLLWWDRAAWVWCGWQNSKSEVCYLHRAGRGRSFSQSIVKRWISFCAVTFTQRCHGRNNQYPWKPTCFLALSYFGYNSQ